MSQAKTHTIQILCRVLQVSRSGYYEWRQRGESPRARTARGLQVALRAVFAQSEQTYGAISIHRALVAQGHACSKNRVARLMRQAGVRSVHRQKYRPQTTDSRHGQAVSPNVLQQDFTATAPNQKWGADISYFPTAEGSLYVAVVLDVYSRKIVGWATGDTLAASLCCTALHQACRRRQPPAALVHHSDRGGQYASADYRQVLAQHQCVQSMSRTGNCYDNAMVESFFHTLKVERVHRRRYRTRADAAADIADYIERFYNNWRRHSALDYQCPTQYEQNYRAAA